MSAVRFVLVLILLLGLAPRGASAETAAASALECVSGTGWRWVSGSDQPQAAQQARATLALAGVLAQVSASGYGEVDDCGTYLPRGVDLRLTLSAPQPAGADSQQALEQRILAALGSLPGLRVGNIHLSLPGGHTQTLHANTPAARAPFSSASALPTIHKKVYVVAYNPYIDDQHTMRLWEYFHWNSYEEITQGTIDFFRHNSGGQIQYSVVDTTVVDAIPEKQDGFVYTIDEYIHVINNPASAHQPDAVNYNKIVNDPQLDICGKANRGEIDEVWVFNGPYYGFWESTLVGPGSYWYNSPPVEEPWTCTRMIPIMGPNPERWISEHVEDFGHRTESTMAYVYDYQWENGPTRNTWEAFTLLDSNPHYTYSGCGNVHFPPNGQSDYDWSNPGSAKTNCDDFFNYPNLPNPPTALQTVTCATWNCTGLDYFGWWYRHLPRNPGCGPDGVANNWWSYFAYPELAVDPPSACQTSDKHPTFVPLLLRAASGGAPATINAPAQTGDGEVISICSVDWAACRDSAAGNAAWTTYDSATLGASRYPDGHYEIKRVFLRFDTSALPANALITGAVLRIHAGQFLEGGDRRLHVTQGMQMEPLSGGDFSRVGFQTGGFGDVQPNTWLEIPLSQPALNWITRGGITRLAVLHELDWSDSAPSTHNTLLVDMAESPNPPLLTVHYQQP